MVKLNRTDTTLDLSHYGKGSWRRKGSILGEEGTLFIVERKEGDSEVCKHEKFVFKLPLTEWVVE